MRFFNVKQEEIVVVPASHVAVLTSGGVSTCICILARGYILDIPYLAMYHWDGFNASLDKQQSDVMQSVMPIVDTIFQKFATIISQKMLQYTGSLDHKPTLDALYAIGGERASLDVSGTELEV